MIAGHFGFAAMVKSRTPRVPFAILALASVWLDVVFVPLFAAGIEPIESVPGAHGGYGEAIIHAQWTHSLAGALVLSVILGLVAVLRWGKASGAIVGGVAVSHWLLDLVMHREDMPLVPGGGPLLGFGLWRNPAVAIAVEFALVAAGTLLYARAAVARDARRGKVAALVMLASGLVTLVLSAVGQ